MGCASSVPSAAVLPVIVADDDDEDGPARNDRTRSHEPPERGSGAVAQTQILRTESPDVPSADYKEVPLLLPPRVAQLRTRHDAASAASASSASARSTTPVPAPARALSSFSPAFPGPFRLISLRDLLRCTEQPLPQPLHPHLFDVHQARDAAAHSFDRASSLLVFASASTDWMRAGIAAGAGVEAGAGAGSPRAGSAESAADRPLLLQLICAGASRLWADLAPSRASCYIWLDSAMQCSESDDTGTDVACSAEFEQRHMALIEASCDCVLTPVVDQAWRGWRQAAEEERVESSEAPVGERGPELGSATATAVQLLQRFEAQWLGAYRAGGFLRAASQRSLRACMQDEGEPLLAKTLPSLQQDEAAFAFAFEGLLAACIADANFCGQPGLRRAAGWLLAGPATKPAGSPSPADAVSDASAVTGAELESDTRALALPGYADSLAAAAKRYFRLESSRRDAFAAAVRAVQAEAAVRERAWRWKPHFVYGTGELQRSLPAKLVPSFDLTSMEAADNPAPLSSAMPAGDASNPMQEQEKERGEDGGGATHHTGAEDAEDVPASATAASTARVVCKLLYPDGSTFEGTVRDGLRDGKGSYTWPDGSRYRGHYQRGRRHGTGVYESVYSSYSGGWEDGVKNGRARVVTANEVFDGEVQQGLYVTGVQTFANGDRYEGAFACTAGNSKTGEGVFYWSANGDRYAGQWRDDKQHGFGTHTFASGSSYSGMYVAGCMHGRGTYKTAAGDAYVGEFVHDQKQGAGQYTWKSGDSYVGNYVANMRQGRGTYTRVQACEKYSGFWDQDAMSGQGLWLLPDGGGTYEGAFKDGLQHGFGILKYPNGSRYEGEFKEGVMHGDGTFSHANGSIYSGQYNAGLRHMRGVYTRADGSSYDGEWLGDKMDGSGVYRWPNGDTYTGQFKGGQRHGRGTKAYEAGGLKTGLWANDEFME